MERIGRYEIVGHLASGGMGQVYLARSTGLGGFERKVVVKTLDSSAADADAVAGDALVRMFLDEARLVAALHHQFIAPVYEVGCDDEGRYFLVMDYVRGETAEAAWKAACAVQGPPRLAFSLTVVCAVASALEYAHAMRAPDGLPLDIVHRDVSLSNIMIGFDGGVKLIDFGIAKFARRTTTTQIGSLKGKLAYMSPEQVRSMPVDRRSDLFSLGIVLYELTTHARAFDGGSELLTLEKITKGDFTPPSQVVDGYPRELERIVMKALEVDPDDRYQDAGEMGRDLAEFADAIGLVIGHAPVIAAMCELFDKTPPGGRRRVRAADELELPPIELDELTTRPHHTPAELMTLDDDDEQPTSPIEIDIDLETPRPTIQRFELAEGSTGGGARYARPTIPLRPSAPTPVPGIEVIMVPSPRAGTSTDKVAPYRAMTLPPAPQSRWSWPALLITVATITAIAVALIR